MQWVLRIIDQPLSAWITLLIVGGLRGLRLPDRPPRAARAELHAHRRRHGRPRVGSHVPAQARAAARARVGLDPRLVRRLPCVRLLHGRPGAGHHRRARGPALVDRAAGRAGLPGRGGVGLRGARPVPGAQGAGRRRGAGRGALHPRALQHGVQARHRGRDSCRCRSRRGPSPSWPTSSSRRRRCSPSRRCSTCTTASRWCTTPAPTTSSAPATSSAATWPRRWRASTRSRSPSRCR